MVVTLQDVYDSVVTKLPSFLELETSKTQKYLLDSIIDDLAGLTVTVDAAS